MSKTFDFTNTSYLENWDTKSTYFRMGNNGLQLKRSLIGSTNILAGTTLNANAGTTINSAASAVDWETATICTLQGTDVQSVYVDLGSGSEKYLRKLIMRLVSQASAETYGDIEIAVSSDDTLWTIRPHEDIEDGVLYLYDDTQGIYFRYIRFNTAGTSLDSDSLRFREVEAYESVYPTPFQIITHSQSLYTDGLTAVSANSTEPSNTSLTIQLLKNGEPFYWNSDDSEWQSAGIDTSRYDEFSTTIATANSNIASFITASSDEVKVGLNVIFQCTESLTPAVEDITLTT